MASGEIVNQGCTRIYQPDTRTEYVQGPFVSGTELPAYAWLITAPEHEESSFLEVWTSLKLICTEVEPAVEIYQKGATTDRFTYSLGRRYDFDARATYDELADLAQRVAAKPFDEWQDISDYRG